MKSVQSLLALAFCLAAEKCVPDCRLYDYPGSMIILLVFRSLCPAAGGWGPDRKLYDYSAGMINWFCCCFSGPYALQQEDEFLFERLHDYLGCMILLLFLDPYALQLDDEALIERLHDFPDCMIIQVAGLFCCFLGLNALQQEEEALI